MKTKLFKRIKRDYKIIFDDNKVISFNFQNERMIIHNSVYDFLKFYYRNNDWHKTLDINFCKRQNRIEHSKFIKGCNKYNIILNNK